MKTPITAKQLITKFDLKAHPEGGYYRETYRSIGSIKNENLPNTFNGDRNFSTAIYFLLTSEKFSAFHKINQDEIWHFYQGSSLLLHTISPDGNYAYHRIGNNIEAEEIPQLVVPAGYWFAAEVSENNTYAFTGCTVAPGFDFKDFVLPKRKELVQLFPDHESIITKLTHH